MIPKDMGKNRIKEVYHRMLREDQLKETDKGDILRLIVEKFNSQNASGLVFFGVPESHENAIELVFSEDDRYIKGEDILNRLIDLDIIDLDLVKEDLNAIRENFFNEEIIGFDYETFDDGEEPYMVYIDWA